MKSFSNSKEFGKQLSKTFLGLSINWLTNTTTKEMSNLMAVRYINFPTDFCEFFKLLIGDQYNL